MKYQQRLRIIQSASLMLLFSAFLVTTHAQTVNLQLQNDYTNDGAAYAPSIAVGDVNNDGLPDLVATNRPSAGGDFIAVYLNNGAGGFNATPLPAGTNLSARVVTLGDFNKDGNLDMVIGTDSLTTGLNIRMGNGTGNFPAGAATGSTVIESVSDLVNADFNGDGNLDLAMTKVGGYNTMPSNAVKIWFGNGMGGFSGFVVSALMFGGAQDLEVSDFNVDGRPDIAATAPNSNVVQILINNGVGGFNAALNTTSTGARKIASADFNRDCIPDLAVTRNGTNVVTIFLGNGTGGFGAPNSMAVPIEMDGVAVGDFNRDRKVDVAFRNVTSLTGNPNFTILPGNGAGSFGSPFVLTLPVSGSAANSLAVLDSNLDGKTDIIISRQGGFALYHGNSALFTRTENDFDGDLKTDQSVFRPSNGFWYLNRTTQGFSAQKWGLSTDRLTPADYDGDGKTDLAIWREGAAGQAAFYVLNSSNGTIRIEQFGQTGDDPAAVGDWDGDGKAEPATYRSGAIGPQSYFYYRGSVSNPSNSVTYVPWGTVGDQMARGDFDGDGKTDAAVFRPSNGVWYIRHSGNGQAVYQYWGLASDRRVPADYDGDGKTDLAVLRPSTNFWYILNSGSATSTILPWGVGSDSLTPGDYNGDGRTDIAVYRGSDQHWYTPQCADFKMYGIKFGAAGDVPVPSAFTP